MSLIINDLAHLTALSDEELREVEGGKGLPLKDFIKSRLELLKEKIWDKKEPEVHINQPGNPSPVPLE